MKLQIYGVIVVMLLATHGCVVSKYAERRYLDAKTKATDAAINESPALQDLNRICTEMRLPEDFEFDSKGGIDDEKTSLSYYYRSKIRFEVARRTFEDYYFGKGWTMTDLSHRYPPQLEFTDGEVIIAISSQTFDYGFNYGIYCEKLPK
jgi:hypothetical protein